jgi:hypothetical protein
MAPDASTNGGSQEGNRPGVRILNAPEIRRHAGLDQDALDAVADGFTALARGRAQVPPIMFLKVPERGGEVDVKSALIEGFTAFAIKIASGFTANARDGLPTAGGMMILLSAETGFPLAVLLDEGYLTDLRTALAGAVAPGAPGQQTAPPRAAYHVRTAQELDVVCDSSQCVRVSPRRWGADCTKYSISRTPPEPVVAEALSMSASP